MITSTTIHLALKRTLDKIADDDMSTDMIANQYMDMRPMTDAYHDDLEVGGPGLISEVSEGGELPIGTIYPGYTKRWIARKYGQRIIVTDETMEDNKYPETIRAAQRLKRAIYKTADIDAALVLHRAWNSSYLGGDGVSLCSASHTLPNGGTWSNTLATPLSPSRSALIVMRAQVMTYPGHDGLTEGYELRKVVFPVDQWGVWEGLVGSDKAPENDTNEINVVKGLNLKLVPNKYWDNTTTNWMAITDAELGMAFRWRRKPRSKTWMTNEQELEQFGISARWDTGWTDARGVCGSQA